VKDFLDGMRARRVSDRAGSGVCVIQQRNYARGALTIADGDRLAEFVGDFQRGYLTYFASAIASKCGNELLSLQARRIRQANEGV